MGSGGSRKHLIASADQSLTRTGLDYFDIFYHHCPDPQTPVAESIGALDTLVKQGKAIYVGISKYSPEDTMEAVRLARDWHTPLIVHQPRYNMLTRHIEQGLVDDCERLGLGIIAFSPLAQGLLTTRYLDGNIPPDSRAALAQFLKPDQITEDLLHQLRALNAIAANRNQSLAQLALTWALRDPRITSLIIGASRVEQLEQNVSALQNTTLTEDELAAIDAVLARS